MNQKDHVRKEVLKEGRRPEWAISKGTGANLKKLSMVKPEHL